MLLIACFRLFYLENIMSESKGKKTMTEAAIEANRQNAQLSTGPKTEEGLAISSMNALKTGEYSKHFWKIPGSVVGDLKICETCGDEQIAICKSFPKEERTCLLHESLMLKYIKTHQTKDVKYIEEVNIMQLSIMDFLFTQNLRYAQLNIGEVEEAFDSLGKKYYRPKIGNDYIYMLINFMKVLSKSMPDMQLTRQTQENIDVEWAKLLEAEIDPEKAMETKNKIIASMAEFRKASSKAKYMENQDEAIQQFKKGEDLANEDSDSSNLSDIGDNPFGKNS